MATQHIVVDGSNIATEGRSTPSLDQLEGAVAELRKEFPDAEVTVVVDATFAHRIDPSELARYEKAALRGETISPPAGAIGRGDAFLLRIAEKVDGVVLSNDSFQEFHGEHPWLFDRGRLLGATPVPGIGWIFVPRTPVRGPKSRVAVRDTERARARVEKAIAAATKEVVAPTDAKRRAPRQPIATGHPQAVNDPATFIGFIAEHHLGERIDGEVESFTSHGAVVRFGAVRCYAPLSGLGSPPPRSAREALRKGEHRSFVVTALDPYRRGVELALPEVAVVSGRPSEETVAAEVRMARSGAAGAPVAARSAAKAPARRGRRTKEQAPVVVAAATPPRPADAAAVPPKRVTRRPTKVAAESGIASSLSEPVAKAGRTPAKRTTVKQVVARSTEPAPSTAKRATRKATAGKATAKQSPEEKAPSRRASAAKASEKAAAPAKRVAAAKKEATAKKTTAKAAAASKVGEPTKATKAAKATRTAKTTKAAQPEEASTLPAKRTAGRRAAASVIAAKPSANGLPRKSPARRAAR